MKKFKGFQSMSLMWQFPFLAAKVVLEITGTNPRFKTWVVDQVCTLLPNHLHAFH